MSRSILKQTFNQEEISKEWEEAYYTTTSPTKRPANHFNPIFSDDEDDGPSQSTLSRWFSHQYEPLYIDPVLSSSTYHVHQADNALLTLKHVVKEENEQWKKVLKHKSGVMVHMKNGLHKGDKTPIFKGEAVIQGFTPQAIFYVVGMRKLWDEQYEDGNLVENLNDTTSLTYESMKPTATSKARDLALVEKIECTQNGTIIFACTSVETPSIPRIHGKTRSNVKLLGWILEPLNGTILPVTKVTYVIQECLKGWVPGLAKKTLARRPLVIAKVAEYLEKKTERIMKHQQERLTNDVAYLHYQKRRRPSVMSTSLPTTDFNPVKKHISFADQQEEKIAVPQNTGNPLKQNTQLYPSHRHDVQKVESLQLLKRLSFLVDHWDLIDEDGKTKYYTFSKHNALDSYGLLSKKNSKKIIRVDSVIEGGWTAEQLCSVIHCYGSRKIWDVCFKDGRIIERFSQKEYLVQWFLGGMIKSDVDLSAITSIETDAITGTVYEATTSVMDDQIPPDESGHCLRAYTDLYGWVFRPSFDESGRTVCVQVSFVCSQLDFRVAIPSQMRQSWIDKSLQSISHLNDYLNQYGCPPYIRRVAGKVLEEDFDTLTNRYEIVFIAKHQPSSSYRARKQNTSNTVWCTDIRFHEAMYAHGLDIYVKPDNVSKVQVSFSQKSIKIFTTTGDIDGKTISFTLVSLSGQHHSNTYRINGRMLNQQQKVTMKVLDNVDEDEDMTLTIRSPPTPKVSPSEMNQPVIVVDRKPSTLTTGSSIKKSPRSSHILSKAEIENGNDQNVGKEETLRIPNGYLLVPEQQNANIIILTDELSFNGPQIAVIFLAMVVCYYMGKFTSSNSC